MSKPILYYSGYCPAVRSVLLTAKAIGLDLELKSFNLALGEHLTEEFKSKNPQQTVPTLEDTDGTVIWDSHAISTYLISKYAKNDSLYPKDLITRAKIDQRLHFDSGILFPRVRDALRGILLFDILKLSEDKVDGIEQAYKLLELFLQSNDYLVGNKITVADLCCISTVSSLDVVIKIDSGKYPNLDGWIKRLEKMPFYNVNAEGLKLLKETYLNKIALLSKNE